MGRFCLMFWRCVVVVVVSVSPPPPGSPARSHWPPARCRGARPPDPSQRPRQTRSSRHWAAEAAASRSNQASRPYHNHHEEIDFLRSSAKIRDLSCLNWTRQLLKPHMTDCSLCARDLHRQAERTDNELYWESKVLLFELQPLVLIRHLEVQWSNAPLVLLRDCASRATREIKQRPLLDTVRAVRSERASLEVCMGGSWQTLARIQLRLFGFGLEVAQQRKEASAT